MKLFFPPPNNESMQVWFKPTHWYRRVGEMLIFCSLYRMVTLKIRSRSTKSATLCILKHYDTIKFGENPSFYSRDNVWESYFGENLRFQCASVALMRSRSPNLINSAPSKQCIYARMVKLHPLVQEIVSTRQKVIWLGVSGLILHFMS